MESSKAAEVLSLKVFVRNVVGFKGLDSELMAAAQAELGVGASVADVADRASGLLLEALLSVGIDPRTERVKRDLLKRALRGDLMPEADIQTAVEYVLSQMILQPKATLAECLAIPVCIARLDALKSSGLLPRDAEPKRGVWARRAMIADDFGVSFAEWREAADMLFCAPVVPEMKFEVGQAPSRMDGPGAGDLLVFGVAEVKCSRNVGRRELAAQMEKHLARWAGGLQLRDPRKGSIEREYLPSQIWYAVPVADLLYVVCAQDQPFQAGYERANDRFLSFAWTDSALGALVRLSIGPKKFVRAGSRTRVSPDPFGAVLPYDENELEEMGLSMAYYTLGAMADQPDLDLSGDEWSYNLERALSSVSAGLSRLQVARRAKMLSRLG